MRKIWLSLVLASPLALMGCSPGDSTSKSGSAGKSGDKAAEPAKKVTEPVKKAAAKVAVNPEIEAMVKAAAENCTVTENSASVYSCKNNETSKFNDFVREKKPKDAFETLSEIASGTDKKLAATAVGLLNGSMSYFDEALKKENATEAAAKGPADLTVAALDAPRSMYKNTAEEKAVYCPWAKSA